jgi:ABC-type Fe3+/spermidine/putrescine transport system ATPase subunit
VQQDATPTELFNRPRTEFVARFIGSANVLAGIWRDGALETAAGLRIRTDGSHAKSNGARAVVAVRPQNVKVAIGAARSQPDPARFNAAGATISLASYRGSYWLCSLRLESGEDMQAHVAADENGPELLGGSVVTAYWEPRHTIPVIPDS